MFIEIDRKPRLSALLYVCHALNSPFKRLIMIWTFAACFENILAKDMQEDRPIVANQVHCVKGTNEPEQTIARINNKIQRRLHQMIAYNGREKALLQRLDRKSFVATVVEQDIQVLHAKFLAGTLCTSFYDMLVGTRSKDASWHWTLNALL